MNNKKYQQLVDKMTPKENRLSNIFISLTALLYLTLSILIAITALITALSKADTLFTKFKCGLIIPITGFAHSIASCIVDYKKEGFINIGSNTFKLAGSVLLYGIVSAILLTIIKVILNV